jgi:hypothetical protein
MVIQPDSDGQWSVIHLGCIEPKLVDNRAATIRKYGWGYGPASAGAAAAIFTQRDRDSVIGQFLDAWKVRPYKRIVARVHLSCGKIAILTGPGGEHEGMYDPANVGQLYTLTDAGLWEIQNALVEENGEEARVPGLTEVVRIDPHGDMAGGTREPRPDHCPPLSDGFYATYGEHLRPVYA